jgi:hypothetical protein
MIVAGFVGDVLRGENPDKLTSYYDAASFDDIQIVKLYPKGSAEARFKSVESDEFSFTVIVTAYS